MRKYAFAMPGKIGDALYTLPTIHTICERDGAVADFYTSEMCRPAEKLFRYQKHINDFIIPPEYVIDNEGQGVQPWKMPIKGEYEQVYQMGYEYHPQGPLHKFIGRRAGEAKVPLPSYDFPDISFYEEPYVVVGFSKLRGYPGLYEGYRYLIENCPIKVVQTGLPQDYVEAPSENQIGLDLLKVLSLLSKARAFVGFYSGLLVLANGFPNLPRVVTIPTPGTGEQHGLHLPNTAEIVGDCRMVNFSDRLLSTAVKAIGEI
jgi:hypothetical protein